MVVILEADLSNEVSYHFSDYIHFYEKHVHKKNMKLKVGKIEETGRLSFKQ